MPHFFATADDLLPVFASVESKRAVKYTLSDHADDRIARSHFSGASLPTLRLPSDQASAVNCHAYLVSEAAAEVVTREIQGGRKWAVDQLVNPDSTMLWHGAMYGRLVLLHGRVATVSKTTVATSLQRAYASAIKKHFVRVKAFYVGPQAAELLDRGFRLTMSAESPVEYDLKR